MIGNYAGVPCRYTTPLQGLGKYTATIHKPGCGKHANHFFRRPYGTIKIPRVVSYSYT
jgi:hypothetical protein